MLSALRDRPKLYSFGSKGPGVYLTDELLASIAYRTLPAIHKLVLIRALRTYEKASGGDREDLSGTGFVFTFKMCGGDCTPKSFYQRGKKRKAKKGARANIVAHGFFSLEPTLKSAKPGAPDRFLPSGTWRKYKGTSEELVRLKRHDAETEAYLQRAKARKATFLQAGKHKPKPIGKKAPDTKGKKAPDTKGEKAVIIGKKAPDTKRKTGTPHRKKSHGLIDAIPGENREPTQRAKPPRRKRLSLDDARDCGGVTSAFNEWRGGAPDQTQVM